MKSSTISIKSSRLNQNVPHHHFGFSSWQSDMHALLGCQPLGTHLIENVQAEVRTMVVTLESEMVDVPSDTGRLLTVAPKSDQGKPQDMFIFSNSTPAASSLFGYMMSAVPFSDRSEATLETRSVPAETIPQHTSDSTFITGQAVKASNITDLPKPNDNVTNKDLIPVTILDTYAVQMQRTQDYHHSETQELRMEYKKQLKEKNSVN
jgi:hypothetical protein